MKPTPVGHTAPPGHHRPPLLPERARLRETDRADVREEGEVDGDQQLQDGDVVHGNVVRVALELRNGKEAN